MRALNILAGLAVILALVSAILVAFGSVKAHSRSGQTLFVTAWTTIMVMGLVLLQNY